MLEHNRFVQKKIALLTRIIALVLPVVCIVLLLSQTALAKTTYRINDGGRVLIHSTYATDPAEVLDEAGLELGEDDTYITQGGEITIQRMQNVTVIYDEKTYNVTSYGETVEELLSRMALILAPEDVLSLPLYTATYDGMLLTITRAAHTEMSYSTTIPHGAVYCYDPALAEGEQKILVAGVDGEVLCTATVYYVDGVEVSRVVTSEVVTRQPVDQVIAIGTYVDHPDPVPMPEEPVPTESKPTEPKPTEPAAPESEKPAVSGNTITTPDGVVLEYTQKLDCVATAYSCNGVPGYTYSGTPARVGAIAVDPSFIPLGTQLYIYTNDGEYIYGVAVAEDIGGAIKGNIIDLYFDTFDECWQFGVRDCTVYILA